MININKKHKTETGLLLSKYGHNFAFMQYYQRSSIKKPTVQIRRSSYPEDWKRIFFKTYPRFRKVKIKHFKNDNLIKIINKRKSERNFNRYKIKLKEIFYILRGGAINRIIRNDLYYNSYRAYPSAGARYPLEIYLFVLFSRNKKLDSGIYHYNVKENCLEYMWDFSIENLKKIFGNQKFVLKSSVIFVITADMKRGISKYKERYFRLVLLEAGHLVQNFLLLATNINLKTCPVGGFIEKDLLKILDIKEIELEIPIYALAIGK